MGANSEATGRWTIITSNPSGLSRRMVTVEAGRGAAARFRPGAPGRPPAGEGWGRLNRGGRRTAEVRLALLDEGLHALDEVGTARQARLQLGLERQHLVERLSDASCHCLLRQCDRVPRPAGKLVAQRRGRPLPARRAGTTRLTRPIRSASSAPHPARRPRELKREWQAHQAGQVEVRSCVRD